MHARKLKELKTKLELFGDAQADLFTKYRFEAKFKFEPECFGYFVDPSLEDDDPLQNSLITCFNEENENEIKVWELKSNSVCKRLSGHTGRLNCTTIYKKTKLISGGNDHLIKVWSLQSGECLSTLVGHTNTVRSLKVIKGKIFLYRNQIKVVLFFKENF